MRLRMVPILAAAVAATVAAAAGPATRATAARDLAAGCSVCHRIPGAGGIPDLAGMPPQALIAAMEAFRSGARPGTVMPQLARGYTDRQVESIAAWLAAQKATK